jgi:hypothetical protein
MKNSSRFLSCIKNNLILIFKVSIYKFTELHYSIHHLTTDPNPAWGKRIPYFVKTRTESEKHIYCKKLLLFPCILYYMLLSTYLKKEQEPESWNQWTEIEQFCLLKKYWPINPGKSFISMQRVRWTISGDLLICFFFISFFTFFALNNL